MEREMCVVPKGGGWRFNQRLPNGSYHPFLDNTEEGLFLQVRKFRLDNNMPVDGLEEEIKKGVSAPRPVPVYGEGRSLRERVTGWKANRAYQKLTFVEPDEAERRAKICVDCKYNWHKYADDCIECYAHVERDLYAMRQGRATEQDTWLGACEIAGHENKTAVQLAGDNLLHRNNFLDELNKKAPHCWMLHLDEDGPKEVG